MRTCSHSPAALPDGVGDPANGRVSGAASQLPWQDSWGCYLVSTRQRPAAALGKTCRLFLPSLPEDHSCPSLLLPASLPIPLSFLSWYIVTSLLYFLFVLGNDGKNLRGKIKRSYNVSPREHRAKIQCCFCSLFPMPVSHKMRILLYTFIFWLFLPFYYINATLTCYEMLFKNNFSEWGAVFKFRFSFCLCFLKKITICA